MVTATGRRPAAPSLPDHLPASLFNLNGLITQDRSGMLRPDAERLFGSGICPGQGLLARTGTPVSGGYGVLSGAER
jgi:hypothetical protein